MSLTTLPLELLEQCVSYLPGSQARYNVLLTCKTTRDVVIPTLYKAIDMRARTTKLIRCLEACPKNASYVQQLSVTGWLETEGQCAFTAEDSALCNRILERQQLSFESDSFSGQTRFPEEGLDWESLRNPYHDRSTIPTLLAAVFVALAPNANLITYCSSLKASPAFLPRTLPHLRCLSVYHWDTKNGCDFSLIQGILKAAPNVDHLHGCSVESITSLTRHEFITKLNMTNSNLVEGALDKVFEAFPNLETLSIEVAGVLVGNYHMLPREVSDAMLKHRPRLRHVWLEYVDMSQCYLNVPEESVFEMQSLAFMDSLESLHIHAGFMYGEFYERLGRVDESGKSRLKETPDEQFVCQSPGLLIEFLPKSIRKLSISNLPARAKENLSELISVASQQFPHLKEVRFANIEPKLIPLLNGFEEQGIQCTHIMDRYHEDEVTPYKCPYWRSKVYAGDCPVLLG